MLFNLLANGFEANTGFIHLHVDDLTQAESLIQPPANGNCLNWILGHVIASRHVMLDMLGAPALWDKAQLARYEYGAEPILEEGPGVLPIADLLRDIDATGARLAAALREQPAEAAERVTNADAGYTLGSELLFLFWHEGYHIGQMDFSRKLAGRTNKLI